MKIELERTFLLKNIPAGMEKCKSIEIIDIYIPKSAKHPILRIRKKGGAFEITKKYPLVENDSSEYVEHTISLAKEEFEELSQIEGKRLRKNRYFYPFEGKTAEIEARENQRHLTSWVLPFTAPNQERETSCLKPRPAARSRTESLKR